MKKWLTSFMALLLVFAFALPTQAQSSGVSVVYNGEKLAFSEPAFVEKGKTYVPIRSFFEELEYEVSYKGAQKEIILDWANYESIIHLDTMKVTEYDDVIIENLDLVYRNHTYYAPIRELEPVTITTTKWDSAAKTVYIIDDYTSVVEEDHVAPEGFLWKVAKGDKTAYMLGSIHVGDVSMYPLRDAIYEAYDESDIVVTEVDISREPSEDEMVEIEKLLYYQDGTTLKDHLTPELYNSVISIAKEIGMEGEDLKEFETYQVWFVNMLFASLADASEASAGLGVDLHFLLLADEDELPTGELESFMLQYNMLSGFSSELQEQLLQETVTYYEYLSSGMELPATSTDYLLEIWADGNLEALDEIANEMKSSNLEYYDGLLTIRNVGMTDKIEQYLNEGSYNTYFVIAGALHFAGEDSIIKMLEERGYTVERL